MRAFRVFYETSSKSASTIVLAEYETKIEEAVANKDKDYRIGKFYCKISNSKEVPLSNVCISDLSVTEFMMILKEGV